MAPALLKLMVLASALVAAEMGSREPSDSAERCLSEDEVEDSEERLVSIMQTELLQKEVRRFKASDKFPMRTDAVGEDEATLVAGELAEQELLAQLIRKEESLASISKDIQSNKVAVHEIMSSPHKQLSAQAQAPSSGPVDCEKYPMFCDPKVNCSQNPLTEDDRKAIGQAAGNSGWSRELSNLVPCLSHVCHLCAELHRGRRRKGLCPVHVRGAEEIEAAGCGRHLLLQRRPLQQDRGHRQHKSGFHDRGRMR
ncbi:unnamed protein product [Polarella glacialis]|nr:unnamed protein product [Polarella glacialis]